jgi:hypothetical protein
MGPFGFRARLVEVGVYSGGDDAYIRGKLSGIGGQKRITDGDYPGFPQEDFGFSGIFEPSKGAVSLGGV